MQTVSVAVTPFAEQRLPALPDGLFGEFEISGADDLACRATRDRSLSAYREIGVHLANGARIVDPSPITSSGTGSAGPTLRVYPGRFAPDPARRVLADITSITVRDRSSRVA
jgi:hypothetical protein